MIDLPANWAEKIQNVDWSKVKAAVADYGPALEVVKGTWSKETLAEIADGKLFVPDSVINDAIAKRLVGSGTDNVEGVTLTSKANGRLEIDAATKSVGKIKLSGDIEEFVHSGDKAYIVYHVRERSLPDHGLMSWIFSRVSLSMVEKMLGRIELSDDLPLKIGHHNRITLDYSQVLANSDFGKTTYQGHRLLDMIEIKGAVPKGGGIEFQTELNIPDDVQAALKALVTD